MTDIDANKLRRLDGGLLLVFRELLRTGRASIVAERLGLSQPAISHALKRLRDLFDDPLFIRRPHGFEPTRRALDLGPRVEALIALAGETFDPDRRFDPARSTRLFRMGAPEFVTALIGATLINRLKAVAPRVTFGVGHVAEADAFQALRTGEIDFAVGRFGPSRTSRVVEPRFQDAIGRFGSSRSGYVVEPLFEDTYCIAVRRGHPRIQGTVDHKTWREIGHVFAWSRSETGEDQGDDDEGRVIALASVPHWLTALALVAQTDGIATVPRRLAERHADMLGLQVIEPPFAPHPIRVSVMRRSGVADPGVDWFLGEVKAAVGA